MDGQDFDRTTQQFGRILSRRRVGAALAALGFASGLGGAGETSARKGKKRGKRKKKGGARTCTPGQPCGSDADGACVCDIPATGGPPVCNKAVADQSVLFCVNCPAGTTCVDDVTEFVCFQPCGADPP